MTVFSKLAKKFSMEAINQTPPLSSCAHQSLKSMRVKAKVCVFLVKQNNHDLVCSCCFPWYLCQMYNLRWLCSGQEFAKRGKENLLSL